MPDPDTVARALVFGTLPVGPALVSLACLRSRTWRVRLALSLLAGGPSCLAAAALGWALGGSAVVAWRGREFGPFEAAAGLAAGQAAVGAAAQCALLGTFGWTLARVRRRRAAGVRP